MIGGTLVSVHPLNLKRMIAGSVRMLCTLNRFIGNPTTGTHSDHQQLVYDPVDPNIVYVASDGRHLLFRRRRPQLGAAQLQHDSHALLRPRRLAIGFARARQRHARPGRCVQKTGSELDGYELGAGSESGTLVVDPSMNTNLHTTPWSIDLRRSTDRGMAWADIRNGMARIAHGNPTPPCSVRHLAVRPGNSNSLVAGCTVVVRDAAGTEIFRQG